MAGGIKLSWKDRNFAESQHNIYKSITPMALDNIPTPIDTVGANITEYIDYDVIQGNTYYYRVGAVRGNDIAIIDEIELLAEELTSPGSNQLIAGDMTAGFFGEVPAGEFITGDDLASLIGLTDGVSINSDDPWLKFAHQGRLLYIAKIQYHRSVAWISVDEIYDVTIGDNNYKCRIIYDNSDYSEWDDLIYKIHVDDPTGSNWESYTNTETGIGTSAGGTATWVYPRVNGYRGFQNLQQSSISTSPNGWRPVLEFID